MKKKVPRYDFGPVWTTALLFTNLPTGHILRIMRSKPTQRATKVEPLDFPIREDGVDLIEVHVGSICVRNQNGTWQVPSALRNESCSRTIGSAAVGRFGRVNRLARQSIVRSSKSLASKRNRSSLITEYQIPITGRQKVIPGVRFLCFIQTGNVHLNQREFTTYRWLNLPLTEEVEWIPGIREVIESVTKQLGIPDSHASQKQQKPRIGFQRSVESKEDVGSAERNRKAR